MQSNSIVLMNAGYTIVELLVATAVISLLIGLTLPAIQTARNSARQTQCLNRMRNLGIALLQNTDTAQRFPACGYFGDGTPGTFGQYRSWIVDILPYLDRGDIYNQWDFDLSCKDPANIPLAGQHIPILTCPSDHSVIPGKGNLSYVLNGGIGFTAQIGGVHNCPVDARGRGLDLNGNGVVCHSSTEDDAAPSDRDMFFYMGLFYNETWKGETRADRHYTMAGITDGTSNTLMISENIRTGYDPKAWTANWSSPSPFLTSFYIGDPCLNGRCTEGNVDYNQANSGSAAINAGLEQAEGRAPFPNSMHTGGVNAGYCDGHFSFLSEKIDGKVYAALASPQGQALAGTLLEQ